MVPQSPHHHRAFAAGTGHRAGGGVRLPHGGPGPSGEPSSPAHRRPDRRCHLLQPAGGSAVPDPVGGDRPGGPGTGPSGQPRGQPGAGDRQADLQRGAGVCAGPGGDRGLLHQVRGRQDPHGQQLRLPALFHLGPPRRRHGLPGHGGHHRAARAVLQHAHHPGRPAHRRGAGGQGEPGRHRRHPGGGPDPGVPALPGRRHLRIQPEGHAVPLRQAHGARGAGPDQGQPAVRRPGAEALLGPVRRQAVGHVQG